MFYKIIRCGQWAAVHNIRFIPGLMTKLLRLLYSCDIPCGMQFPKSVKFAHNGLGCCINKGTVFGENVFIHQNVTIGKREKNGGCPVIGNSVYIGCHAVIIGNVHIGDNVKIGAGSVVLNDVPPGKTCVGVPGRLI